LSSAQQIQQKTTELLGEIDFFITSDPSSSQAKISLNSQLTQVRKEKQKRRRN